MRLRPIPLEVPAEQPFAFDLLDRRQISESLTELLKSSNEGLVLSIHAPWGHGKTTFLKMWRQHLVNDGFKTLYFNAWESDFSEDALVALIGELEVGLRDPAFQTNTSTQARVVESVSRVRKIGAKLLRRSLPVAVKVATAGALDLDDFTEESLAEFGEKVAEDKLKSYEDSRRSIQSFREAIAQVAKDVSSQGEESQPRPLVLVVDELDRCRPSYAIRVLECIKHLFAVPGVAFVLAIDRVQLGHAVKSQYGAGFDSTGYLRRFFDLELSLPEPDGQKFSNAQFERFGLTAAFADRSAGSQTRYDKPNLEELFPILFRVLNCSLRDRERAFALLSFALRSTPRNRLLYPDLLAALIAFKVKEPDVYAAFASGSATPESLLERLEQGPGGDAFLASRSGVVLEAQLHAALAPRHDNSQLIQRYKLAAADNADPKAQARAVEILEVYGYSEMRATFGCMSYLLSKIDLASSVQ